MKPGDLITLHGTGDFAEVKCEVMEVDAEGHCTKMKALVPDKRLLKMGFLQEGLDLVAIEWRWSRN